MASHLNRMENDKFPKLNFPFKLMLQEQPNRARGSFFVGHDYKKRCPLQTTRFTDLIYQPLQYSAHV